MVLSQFLLVFVRENPRNGIPPFLETPKYVSFLSPLKYGSGDSQIARVNSGVAPRYAVVKNVSGKDSPSTAVQAQLGQTKSGGETGRLRTKIEVVDMIQMHKKMKHVSINDTVIDMYII